MVLDIIIVSDVKGLRNKNIKSLSYKLINNLDGLNRDWLSRGYYFSINHIHRMIQHLWMDVENNKVE
jgi:hypothetical protein